MKVFKALITTAFVIIGWAHIIMGWKAEYNGNPDAAKDNYIRSYFWNVPAWILGVLGWNWKKALEKSPA